MNQQEGPYQPIPPQNPQAPRPPAYGGPPPGYGGPPSYGGQGGGYYPPPPPPPPPARAPVVHIVAKPGGLWRAVMFIAGLLMFGVVFVVGITFGVGIMFASTGPDEFVLRQTYRDAGTPIVAVIPVVGAIDERQAAFVQAAVRNVLQDSNVCGVVLRVNSPGGGVSASDQIWFEVKRMRDKGLPVVASYGGVAASGGYYVSCGCDHIIAEETSITGSIGVIAQVLTLEGLMEKIGIQPTTLVATNSPEKDSANDIFRSWTDRDKSTVKTMLDHAYSIFAQRVADGRKNVITDPAALKSIANGSIYTAAQAKDNGLVDGIGYLDDAIAKAETLGRAPAGGATVVIVRRRPTLFGDSLLPETKSPLNSLDAEGIRSLVNDLASPRVLYQMN